MLEFLASNGVSFNVLPNQRYKLIWIRVCYLFLLSITRTFASGKTEKMVMQHLKDLGFASGKVKWSHFVVVHYKVLLLCC